MNIIKVNDIEYNIPTSWDEITIGQQIEISELVNRDESFRNIHMISTYTGIPMEILQRMNINDFKKILNIMKFLKEEHNPVVIKSFVHKGNIYFLADSMLKGETQDFLSIEGILKRFKDNPTKALPYIVAITCKRQGETLTDYDAVQRGEEFLDLPYSTVNNIWFFFAETGNMLSNSIKQYLSLQDKAMEASLSYSESMVKQSDGQGLYKKLAKTYLLWYIKSTRKSWKNFSTTIQSGFSKPTWRNVFQKNRSKNLKIKTTVDAKVK
jgi:hypothetical protein